MSNTPETTHHTGGVLRSWTLPHPNIVAITPSWVREQSAGVDVLRVEVLPTTEVFVPQLQTMAPVTAIADAELGGHEVDAEIPTFVAWHERDGELVLSMGAAALDVLAELGEARPKRVPGGLPPRHAERAASSAKTVPASGPEMAAFAGSLLGSYATHGAARRSRSERDVELDHPLSLGGVRMFFAFALDEAESVDDVDRIRFVLGRELASLADQHRANIASSTTDASRVLPERPTALPAGPGPALEPDETNGASAATPA